MNQKLKKGLEILVLGAAGSFLLLPAKYTYPIMEPVLMPLVEGYFNIKEQFRFLPDNRQIISGSFEQKTWANQYLTQFPNAIPGAGLVLKYEVPDARYCLVHVRQIHNGDISQNVERLGEETRTLQYDIYQILDSLRQHQGIRGVYAEGAKAHDAGTDQFVLVRSVRKIGHLVERFINVAYLTTVDA